MKFFLVNVLPLLVAAWYTFVLCIPTATCCTMPAKPMKIKVHMINSAGKSYQEVKDGMSLDYWQTGTYSYEVKLSETKTGWQMTAKPHSKDVYCSSIFERIIFLKSCTHKLSDMYMDSEMEYQKKLI